MRDESDPRAPRAARFAWLPELDRLLIIGMKHGRAAKRDAIDKLLRLAPELTRGDCWRRLRQLRRLPEFAALAAANDTPAATPESKPSHRGATRAWTAEDDDRLLNWAGYEPVKKIAQRLGRSEYAVRFRMAALGISAKVTDGWSLRSLCKLLRVGMTKIRFLIGSGRLRVRDPRVTPASFAKFFESQRGSLDYGADERFAVAEEKCDEGYSWEKAATILGVELDRIQSLICSGTLKIVDPFVTDRQFEEFCKKHGSEINLVLLDRATAKWLVEEYDVPKPAVFAVTTPSQKHALKVRTCKCGKKIAGNAYFRHVRSCESDSSEPMRTPSNGRSQRMSA
jgi:hypothetical protein